MAAYTCAYCGEPFTAAPGKHRKYCSMECCHRDRGGRIAAGKKGNRGGHGNHDGPQFRVPPDLAQKLGLSEEAV